MHPRARRALQRGLIRWDRLRREALEIRAGDPMAGRLGGVGPGTRIEHPYLFLGNPSAVEVGSHTYIRSGFRVEALAPSGATIITIGDNCQLGYDVRLVAVNGITIADGAGIGHGCTVADTVHDYKSADSDDATWRTGLKVGRPLVVGPNAWIGNNTVVAGGLTVGAGAIVNANSVISRDVPPDTIVGGNPAQVWRQRDERGAWHWVIDPATLELDRRASETG